MSEVSDMLRRYSEIRQRLRYPPNAVPDTGINLRPLPPKPVWIPKEPELNESELKALPPPEPPEPTTLSFASIVQITAKTFGLKRRDIYIKTRKRAISVPRQVAIYAAARQKRWTLYWIARILKMDHTTALHATRRVAFLIELEPSFREKVESIEAAVAALHPPSFSNLSQPYLEAGTERNVSVNPISQMDCGG